MKMIRFATVLLLTVAATAAYAQQNNFDIKTDGKTTGSCHYSFDSGKGGFKITSHYLDHVPPQLSSADAVTGAAAQITTEVQATTNYKLDANYNYIGGSIVNGDPSLTYGYSPNKQRTEMQVSKMEAGAFVGDPSRVDLKPNFVILADFDVSAIQTILYLATTHPSSDNSYFLILPQALGSKVGGPVQQSVAVTWAAQPDGTGTLSGKAVPVKHYTFAYTGKNYDVYADATNTLMEADITGSTNLSYVRSGFALDAAK